MLNLSVKAQSIVFDNHQYRGTIIFLLTGIGVVVSASKLSQAIIPVSMVPVYRQFRRGGAGFFSCCRSNGRLPRGGIRKFVDLCESSLASTFVMSSLSQGSCRRIEILFLPAVWSLSDLSPLIPLGPSFLIIVSNCPCSFL